MSRNTFQKSDFNLGIFSHIIGWISVAWLCITSIFFFLPNKFDENMQQTWSDFNYTPIVVGGVLTIALIYWWLPAPIGARHFFTGPKRHGDEKISEPTDIVGIIGKGGANENNDLKE